MNAQHQFYQLPPTPELTLNDMAPFIARSLAASARNSQSSSTSSLQDLLPPGLAPGTNENPSELLKSVMQEALSLFEDDDDDLFG